MELCISFIKVDSYGSQLDNWKWKISQSFWNDVSTSWDIWVGSSEFFSPLFWVVISFGFSVSWPVSQFFKLKLPWGRLLQILKILNCLFSKLWFWVCVNYFYLCRWGMRCWTKYLALLNYARKQYLTISTAIAGNWTANISKQYLAM